MSRAGVATDEGPPPRTVPNDDRRTVQLSAELDVLEAITRFDLDSAGLATRVQEVIDEARALGVLEPELRGELVASDLRRRAGHVTEAGRTAQNVHRWATDNDAPRLLARSHFVLAAVYQELGDLALALEHAVLSVEALADDAPAALQIDHRARMADCLGLLGDRSAMDGYVEVLALAEQLGDVERQLLILNNSAYTAVLAGENKAARSACERLQELAAQHDLPLDGARLDTVARVLMGLGRLDDAERAMQPGLLPQMLDHTSDGDAGADLLLTHAEVQRLRQRFPQAQASLDECVRRCEAHGLSSIRVRARREQAELHAAGGDYRAAFTEHKTYCEELFRQQSEQRDARARTLHAMYETTEARKQSRRYRELSLRDPLTGLYNRRHIDDELAQLLIRGVVEGDLVTVGLLDLDHFKRVNDTCSHEIGDEVLRRVARLLESAVVSAPEGSFAARMGGEEFLLVLIGEPAADALARCEDLRRAVADRSWSDLTGELPVTVSIGVASASGPTAPTSSELLGGADERLYRAKSRGRDRVVGD